MRLVRCVVVAGVVMLQLAASNIVWGATPLLTDDAVTLGPGKGQFEVCGRWGTDRDVTDGVITDSTKAQLTSTLTVGVADPLDLVLEFSRDWGQVSSQGVTSSNPDAVNFKLSAKFKLLETGGGFSVAVRPDLGYSYLPSGSSRDNTPSYGGVLIATQKLDPVTLHLNIGGQYNDYQSTVDREAFRQTIWSGSLAALWQVTGALQLVTDIGLYTNPDKATAELPVFSCLGAIYSVTDYLDLAGGFKFGLNKPETDLTVQSALVFKF